jgi:hypothetical protein
VSYFTTRRHPSFENDYYADHERNSPPLQFHLTSKANRATYIPFSTMVDLNRFRREPEEDEWFIPYNRPQPPASVSIGHSPSPVRQTSTKRFKTRTEQSFRFPSSPHTPQRTVRKTPSYASLREPTLRVQLPTSVPPGPTTPKLLFSPPSREVRSDKPRSRTFSAPVHKHRDWDTSCQWDAPTVCDRLVLAKPSITPHVITPPASPEVDDVFTGPRVLEDVERRAKEREEWATYVKRRGRSTSFGHTPSGPIIGNARVRAEEFERRSSSRRSSSLGRGSRRSSDLQPTSFGFIKRPSMRDAARDSAQGSAISADWSLRTSLDTGASPHSRRPVPGPPLRTLRIQNPPVKVQGVVVIGPEQPTLDKPLPDLPESPSTAPARTHLAARHRQSRTQKALTTPSRRVGADQVSSRARQSTPNITFVPAGSPSVPEDELSDRFKASHSPR